MAKMDANAFKKNHFWFLFIPVAICALLAIFGVFGVADATETQNKKNKDQKTAIEGTKVVPAAKSKLLEKNKDILYASLDRNWAVAWNAQKDIYSWPAGMLETLRKQLADTKFGTDLSARNDFRIFRDQFTDEYIKEVKKLPEAVAPMQLNGGLDAIVKYVKKMPTPTPEDMWLAMEDLWIQNSVVMTVDGVNKEIATFKPSKPTAENKTSNKFTSRLWELDLQVAETEDRKTRFLKGKLKNITDRLLPFGFDNMMVLKVWLDTDPRSDPFEFIVEGEHLAAGASIDIKTIPAHKLRPNQRVEELARVEQVFDLKTVPVKRIDRLEMGYKSNRQQGLPLKMAPISEKAMADAAGPADPNNPAAAAGPGPGGAAPPGAAGYGGEGGGGMPGAGGANPQDLSPGGLVRKRYIDVTPQVRRLPLGFVVIAEQPYINDLQVAMANSKLRFQITQEHVKRSRDVTAVTPPPSTDPATGGTAGVPGPGNEGRPGGEGRPGTGPMPGGLSGPPPISTGSSAGGGRPGGPPAGAAGYPGPGGPGPGGRGGMGEGRPNMGEGGGRPGMGMPGPGFGGAGLESTNVPPPDQTSNNLVELAVYGVASLYEKFTPAAELAAQAAKDAAAAAAAAEPKK